jgi:acyl-CoA thioesterase-1
MPFRAAFLLTTAFLAFAAGPAMAQQACPESGVVPVAVPHSKAALAHGGELLIVAIGSSSTQGAMASDAGHSYPAILQAELAARLPKAHVSLINRGIGGQDAIEEVPRLESDVIASHPSLVIWQVGANGAMRGTNPDVFRRLVTAGVKRLHAAGSDVVLMDNQRAPMILASADHVRLEQAMADIAVGTGASLFSRGALMDRWQREGQPFSTFISGDGVHHNDLGYRCIAQALAGAIVAGLNDPTIGTPPVPSPSAAIVSRNDVSRQASQAR